MYVKVANLIVRLYYPMNLIFKKQIKKKTILIAIKWVRYKNDIMVWIADRLWVNNVYYCFLFLEFQNVTSVLVDYYFYNYYFHDGRQREFFFFVLISCVIYLLSVYVVGKLEELNFILLWKRNNVDVSFVILDYIT